jgi:hypothetical protein
MQFFDFQEYADTMPPETILTIPHLMLSFTGREELSGEQLASIKEAGLSFRGKGNWPRFLTCTPCMNLFRRKCWTNLRSH